MPRRARQRADRPRHPVQAVQDGRGQVPVVSEEGLVAAVAVERDRHEPARHLAERQRREGGGVGEGLVVVPHQPRDAGHRVGLHHQLVVLGAEMLRHLAGVPGLVVVRPVEPDREGADRPAGHAADERDHGARVEPAAEQGSHGNVADETEADRLAEAVEELLDQRRLVLAPLGGVAQRPVPMEARLPVPEHEVVGGGELPHAAECRPRTGHVPVGEVVMEGDVVRRRGDLGILEDGLRLGGEHEPVGVLVVEERLLPQPVPGQEQRALLPVPDGQGEHPAQPRETLRPVARVEGQDDLGVAPRAEPDARPLQLVPQEQEVVDLAVVGDPQPAVEARHRLVAGRAEILDRQPPRDEAHGAVLVNPRIVGPAVGEDRAHPLEEPGLDGSGGIAEQLAGYAAHARVPIPA